MINVLSAVTDITPAEPLPLAGYADLQTRSRYTFSTLEANVVQLDNGTTNFVFVGVDTLFVGTSLKQGLLEYLSQRELPIDSNRLHLFSSHTHTAPSLDPDKPQLGAFSQDYLDQCISSIGEAVLKSYAEPAKRTTSYKNGNAVCVSSVYRRIEKLSRFVGGVRYGRQTLMAPNTDVEINQNACTLTFYDNHDNPLACFWTWPCHPIATPDTQTVSADFPGAIRQQIRNTLKSPDLPVIYFPGFAGDIRPDFIRSSSSMRSFISNPFIELFADSSPQRFDELCKALTDCIHSALAGTRKPITDTHTFFRLSEKSVRLDTLIDNYDGAQTTLDIQHIVAGPLKILAFNAEVCSPYYNAWSLEDDVFATGYSSGTFGYLPTDEQISSGGYEVEGFFDCFSIRGHFRSNISKSVRSAVQAVLDQKPDRS